MTPGELWRRVRHFVARDHATRELEEEIRLHLELREQRLREQGVPPDDARFAALRHFGNTTTIRQRGTAMWGFLSLDHFRTDIRVALRRLVQQRGLTVAVIAVLALGIGATTAMFSAVDAALLRPLPFARSGELVALEALSPPFDPGIEPGRPPGPQVDMLTVRAMPNTFASVAAYAAGGLNLADPTNPRRLRAGVVTANFFTTLGVAPLRGRTFVAEEGVPNGPRVAILSYALWQSQFGGSDISGLVLPLGSNAYQVVGVMPRGFSFPQQSDVWIPLTVPTTFATFDAFRNFLPSVTIARLTPGVTIPVAAAQLRTRVDQVYAEFPVAPGTSAATRERMRSAFAGLNAIQPLQAQLVGDRTRALVVLLGATGFLLLVACANVTNLLLAQAAGRRREIAMREVLGATRGRLVRQLLTESVVLSCGGALLGVALAPVALRLIGAVMPARLAGVADATIDLRVLAFATALAIATGIAFGLWPALGGTDVPLAPAVKAGGGHGATAAGRGRLRRLLVGAEIALTMVLLVGAGLMLRSFERLMDEENGMAPAHTGTLEMMLSRGPVAQRIATLDAIANRIRKVPGVQAAGFVNDLPLNGAGGIGLRITVAGVARAEDPGDDMARYLMASPGYFDAMGIGLIKGREIRATDDSLAPKVAVVGERMARRFWPDRDPIGQTFSLMGPNPITVVGVVADVREFKLEERAGPQIYLSLQTEGPRTVAMVVRATLPAAALLAQMTNAVREVNPTQAVYNVRMMDQVIGASVAPRRTNTILISAFALLALGLAALGVYGTVAYTASQRRREMGIRAALGASGRDLVRLMSREMIPTLAIGTVIGLGGAWALSRVLASLLYGVTAHDAMTFAVVPIALLAPAVVATLVPARRVARVNPVEVIRDE